MVASMIDDFSYVYWGWAFADPVENVGPYLARGVIQDANGGLNFDNDIELPSAYQGYILGGVDLGRCGFGHGTKVTRLKEGIERFAITDINNPAAGAKAQSSVVVMMDVISTFDASANEFAQDGPARFNHVPGGANVLYMDGHVQFKKYGSGGAEYGPGGALEFSAPAEFFPVTQINARQLGADIAGIVGRTIHP
jgi:prepilin-type processing-associated H-X9-DG protein